MRLNVLERVVALVVVGAIFGVTLIVLSGCQVNQDEQNDSPSVEVYRSIK